MGLRVASADGSSVIGGTDRASAPRGGRNRVLGCRSIAWLAGAGLIVAVAVWPARALANAPRQRACEHGSLLYLTVVALPRGSRARVVLRGPHHLRVSLRQTTRRCLRPGRYTMIAGPVSAGAGQVAYPSTATGAVASLRERFSAIAGHRVDLTVSYYDVAAAGTVVLPAGSARPRAHGRALARDFGAFAAHRSPLTRALKPGEIVVEPVSPGDPAGLLGRVTRVTRSGATVTLATSQVDPFQAFTRASLSLAPRGPTTTVPVSFTGSGAQRRLVAHQSPVGFGCESQTLSASGSVTFNPSATLSLSWSDPYLFDPQITGSYSLTPGASASLTLAATAGVNCQVSVNLTNPPIELAVIDTEFGSFTFNLVAEASLSGSVGERFSQTVADGTTGSVGASFGFGVQGDYLHPNYSLSLCASSACGLSVSQSAGWEGSLSAGIGPALQVLWGAAGIAGLGPQVGLEDQLTLGGSASGWSLSGGVTGTVGFVLDALGYSFSQQIADIPIFSQSITQGSWQPAPSPVMGLTVSEASYDSLTATWQAPFWPGLGGLTGYAVTATPQGGGQAISASCSPACQGTSALIYGLQANTSYTVSVTPSSASGGAGPASTATGTTTAPSPPAPPSITSLSAGEASDGTPLAVLGLSPTCDPGSSGYGCNDGGTPISCYVVRWSGPTGSGSYGIPATAGAGCPSGVTVLSGQTAGSQANSTNSLPLPAYAADPPGYTFTAAAVTSAGSSYPSRPHTIGIVGPATAPTDMTLSAGPFTINNAVTLGAEVGWSPPATDGGQPITGYQVGYFCFPGTPSQSASVLSSLPASARSAVVALPAGATGGCAGYVPTYGQPVTLWVAAVNASGAGHPVSLTTVPIEPPGRPGHVSAAQQFNVPHCARPPHCPIGLPIPLPSATVTWSPPSYDGGAQITGYEVGWSDGSGGAFVSVPASTTKTTLSLGAGSYHVYVLALNSAGQGQPAGTTLEMFSSKGFKRSPGGVHHAPDDPRSGPPRAARASLIAARERSGILG